MITDRETNFVYFSSLIKEIDKYAPLWKRLETILDQNRIPYSFIQNTRDIWCRDYMPIQTTVNDFVQFQYFPDYCLTPKYISKLTIPSETRTIYKIARRKSELIIDGGNVVKSKNSVILTEKVLKDNSDLSRETIISTLKTELHVENVYLIPQLPYEITGHADGMVRFLSETDLLVSDYFGESKTWRAKMDKALEKTGLNIIYFPTETVSEKNKDGDYTAKGTYINFVQIGNIILFPQFNLPTDISALNCAKNLFPDCKIIPINSNEIAIDGGVLKCITWNIKVEQEITFCKLLQKQPDRTEQEKFVYERLDFYFSTFDYLLISNLFELIWNSSRGEIVGDGDFKNIMYRLLAENLDRNYIPQFYVDTIIDLMLEYLESIGQYGFPISEN